jgi:arabinose-5-phosphate isomerase
MADEFPRRGLSNVFSGPLDLASCSPTALQQLFQKQAGYLNYFFSNLEYDEVAKFCQACLDCEGVICFTGVGKSGFIAQKITQTLVSTGTKAVFLSPTDALHGDIGIIGKDDLLVCFSKSGGTEELLKLIPYARVRAYLFS